MRLEEPGLLQRSGPANRRFEFHKRRQQFIGVYNERLSVVAMCVNNPDRSPLGTSIETGPNSNRLC
jgi:hypothetical protein